MNVTELARILKITPAELREKLPQMGFDIGYRAIKVDSATAQKIIQNWPRFMEKLRAEQEAQRKQERKEREAISQTIEIPSFITVRDFAALAGLPVSRIISELMKSGIFISLNESLDFDTAAIIGEDLGIQVVLKDANKEAGKADAASKDMLSEVLTKDTDKLVPRAPVIVVMGHVDHGKTKLLDAIRKTDVVAGEAGGITQHIGAYQVIRRNRPITFIDTPGHEAFTAMRGRGARVADIAILVVAADDGVMPQTVEAFRIIESAKLPYIVAINKVDKPEANIDKTKQELSNQLGIIPEDWGGKVICAPVSAKEGQGVEELLDMVLLTADMEADNIRSNPETDAIGTIIESRIDKGEGPVATILIQNGTLKIGDKLIQDGKIFGKARALKNYKGEAIKSAPPSTPVKIIGLKIAPQVGDILSVGEGEQMDVRKFKTGQARQTTVQDLAKEEDPSIKKVNIIIKSDVLGSAEAIEESLEKINTPEVKVDIVSKGLGNITDGDIRKAEAVKALVLGFNVRLPIQLEDAARAAGVEIKLYRIIYDLINEVKKRMEDLLEPEIVRTDLGKMKVQAIFRTDKNAQVIGGKMIDGRSEVGVKAEIVRNNELVSSGTISKIKSGREDITTVESGQECGMQYDGEPNIAAGDILQFYKEDKIVKKI